MFKKLILSILASVILLVSALPLFARPAHAQVWYDQGFDEWFVKVYDDDNPTEIFGERYTAAQVQWVLFGFISFFIPSPLKPVVRCFLTGDILGDCLDILSPIFGYGPEQNYYADRPGQPSSLLAAVFAERPLSAITYFKDTVRKFHLIPEAKAQAGFGYEGLSIVRQLWQASRNVAYLFFVIAIVIMAFMIMFRVKISPQVVITVQSALPKIVIALVLITFSYAIAGFLVDLMYVVIGLISLVIANSGAGFAGDPLTVFNFLTRGSITIAGAEVQLGIPGLLGLYVFIFPLVLFFVLLWGGGILQGALSLVLLIPAGFFMLLSIIIFLVLLILASFISIKIMWTLLRAFATLLILTIVAPFQIAAGIFIPGTGFGAWARSFVGNLAVFPLTGLLLTLAYIFLILAFRSAFSAIIPAWMDIFDIGVPITATEGWPPLFGIGGAIGEQVQQLLMLGVSLAILFIIPKAADIIKSIVQGRPFAFGTAIGAAFGPVGWGWGAGPVREARQQLSGLGAYRAAKRFDESRFVPRSWRRPGSAWRAFRTRLKERSGYGG